MPTVPLPEESGSIKNHLCPTDAGPALMMPTFPLAAKAGWVKLLTYNRTCFRSSVPEANTFVKEKSVASE